MVGGAVGVGELLGWNDGFRAARETRRELEETLQQMAGMGESAGAAEREDSVTA